MTNLTTTHYTPGFNVTKTAASTIFHRVPIFAECDRGELVFDAAWIASAVREAKLGERSGHLPPLHTRHHEAATEQTDAVRAVGVFRVLEAAPLTFKGKRVTAIYADLIVTDEEFAAELGRMRYPYRSVEIFDPDGPPKINGLALLDHEAPYLELPMLFAGEVNDKRTAAERTSNSANDRPGGIPDTGVAGATFSMNCSLAGDEPMLGSFRRGKSAVLLFKFPDAEEAMNASDKTDTTDTPVDPEAKNFAGDNEDKTEDKKEDMQDDSMDVGPIVKAIESGSISIADMDAIIMAIQSQKTEVTEDEPEDAAPAPVPGAEIMSADNQNAVNFARVAAENVKLAARLDARDLSDKRRDDVANAMKRLEGKPLGADLETRLVNFHKEAKGNAVLFKTFVDTMANTVGNLPDDDRGEAFAAHPKTPKEAMEFQAIGGEAVDKAAHFAREYDELQGHGIRASKESYVRVNMKHAGFDLESLAT